MLSLGHSKKGQVLKSVIKVMHYVFERPLVQIEIGKTPDPLEMINDHIKYERKKKPNHPFGDLV
jgi:hypothetical protein